MTARGSLQLAALSVGSVTMVLVVAEIGLRLRAPRIDETTALIHRRSSDPELLYELVPNAETEQDGVNVRINPQGFRDEPFPSKRLAGEFRIVVLGDSVATGLGVAMVDAFPQQLESLLRKGPPQTELVNVLNLGVYGYSTHQEIRLLETRGLALEPDLVILAYHLNDPDVADGGQARHFRRGRFALIDLVEEVFQRRIPQQIDGREYHVRVHADYAAETELNFKRLGVISKQSGVPILVAVVPVFAWEKTSYPWSDIHLRLEHLAEANDLPFVDLLDDFAAIPPEIVARDGWHPNANGHNVIAVALADWVSDAYRRVSTDRHP